VTSESSPVSLFGSRSRLIRPSASVAGRSANGGPPLVHDILPGGDDRPLISHLADRGGDPLGVGDLDTAQLLRRSSRGSAADVVRLTAETTDATW
jgi:hypothetical protein